VVENMAWFADPATGAHIPIFGEGGAVKEAQRLGVPLLGQIPIETALREAGDAGAPLIATAPDSPASQVFIEMARRLR
jgi:ATP-binding protein involved in chromosome partitioning